MAPTWFAHPDTAKACLSQRLCRSAVVGRRLNTKPTTFEFSKRSQRLKMVLEPHGVRSVGDYNISAHREPRTYPPCPACITSVVDHNISTPREPNTYPPYRTGPSPHALTPRSEQEHMQQVPTTDPDNLFGVAGGQAKRANLRTCRGKGQDRADKV